MKRIVLLCVAMVLALGTLGTGYAMWKDSVTVTTVVHTGTVSVQLTDQWSNDPGPIGIPGNHDSYYANSLDPKEPGIWDGATKTWSTNRWTKNVAKTECLISTIDPKTMTITITNGYPSYWGSVLVQVKNTGSIPVKLLNYELVSVSQNGVVISPVHLEDPAGTFTPYGPGPSQWDGSLVLGTRYWLDQNPELGEVEAAGLEGNEAISFIVSAGVGNVGLEQIEPGGFGYFAVKIHVEQDAVETEGAVVSSYDFKFKINFCNWNE